jgi:hypothetical protein
MHNYFNSSYDETTKIEYPRVMRDLIDILPDEDPEYGKQWE